MDSILENRGELPVLRTYKAPWRGELILACTKCQRKMKKRKGAKAFANLKKWFKRRGKSEEDAPEVRIVGINCIKMCPKGGITIARQHQLGELGGEVSIIRGEADLEGLYAMVARGNAKSQLPRKVAPELVKTA